MIKTLDNLRNRMTFVAENMADCSDYELLDIKNSAEVFTMKIRIELLNRDARAVDEAANLKEDK